MPKLTPKHHRPFTIVKRVSPVAYQLQLPMAWTIHDVFHASLLTPYRETIEHGTNYTRLPPDLIKDAEEYEVETIINHHHFGRKRQLQYLIKWKEYPNADNTWESADHVHAPTLVQTYHRRNPISPPEQDKKGTKEMQGLHPLSQVTSPTTLSYHHNMSSPKLKSYATVYNLQVANLEITLVEHPITTPPPRTPTPKPVVTPVERPSNHLPLTLVTDSEPKEGKIVSCVHHHNYPLSPQSSLNVMQGHPELDAGTLRTIAISLTNTAIGHTFQHLEAKSEIEQLCKELTDLWAEMSRQPDAECSDGFEENHG